MMWNQIPLGYAQIVRYIVAVTVQQKAMVRPLMVAFQKSCVLPCVRNYKATFLAETKAVL